MEVAGDEERICEAAELDKEGEVENKKVRTDKM